MPIPNDENFYKVKINTKALAKEIEKRGFGKIVSEPKPTKAEPKEPKEPRERRSRDLDQPKRDTRRK